MHQSVDEGVATTTPAMVRLLFVASLVVFAISVPLLLMADRTTDMFAWTISGPSSPLGRHRD